MVQTRELYSSANGDRWSLARDPGSGRVFVRHEPDPSSGGRTSDIEVGAFLSRTRTAPSTRRCCASSAPWSGRRTRLRPVSLLPFPRTAAARPPLSRSAGPPARRGSRRARRRGKGQAKPRCSGVAVRLGDVGLTLPQGVPAEPLAHPNRPARPRRAPARPLDRLRKSTSDAPSAALTTGEHRRGGASAVIAAPSGTDVRKPSITPLLGPAGRTGTSSPPGRGSPPAPDGREQPATRPRVTASVVPPGAERGRPPRGRGGGRAPAGRRGRGSGRRGGAARGGSGPPR